MLFFKVVEDLVMYHDALKRLVEKAAVQATLELSKIFRFDTETEAVGRLAYRALLERIVLLDAICEYFLNVAP